MSNILVAGAGGFIGGHLVKRLISDGHKITAVDLKPLENWFHSHAGFSPLQMCVKIIIAIVFYDYFQAIQNCLKTVLECTFSLISGVPQI